MAAEQAKRVRRCWLPKLLSGLLKLVIIIRRATTKGRSEDSDGKALEILKPHRVNPQNVFFGERSQRSISNAFSESASGRSRSFASPQQASFSKQLGQRRAQGASRQASSNDTNARREMLQSFLSHEAALVAEQKATAAGMTSAGSEEGSDGTVKEAAGSHKPQGSHPAAKAPAVLSLTPVVDANMLAGVEKSAAHSETNARGRFPTDGMHRLRYAHTLETDDDDYDADESANTYDGQDPHLRAHLAVMQQHRSSTRAPSSNRINAPFIPAREAPANTQDTVPTSNRRPEGQLVAYFNEHVDAVVAIAVSSDKKCFCSASATGPSVYGTPLDWRKM